MASVSGAKVKWPVRWSGQQDASQHIRTSDIGAGAIGCLRSEAVSLLTAQENVHLETILGCVYELGELLPRSLEDHMKARSCLKTRS